MTFAKASSVAELCPKITKYCKTFVSPKYLLICKKFAICWPIWNFFLIFISFYSLTENNYTLFLPNNKKTLKPFYVWCQACLILSHCYLSYWLTILTWASKFLQSTRNFFYYLVTIQWLTVPSPFTQQMFLVASVTWLCNLNW